MAPPESKPQIRSMVKARPNPFGPPEGSNMPAMASAALIVGVPSALTAQLSGIGRPDLSAMRILALAASGVALPRQMVIGTAHGRATTTAFLPTTVSRAPGA